MQTLKKYYNYVYNLKFPRIPQDDLLDEIFSDLALLDSGYIGLAQTYLNGGKIVLKDISDIEGLKEKIDKISTNSLIDLESYTELKNYIYALFDLAKTLKMNLWGQRQKKHIGDGGLKAF